jgi:hypothetical protein
MRWLNPLNTTQPWPGATNANSVGVKIYPDINAGIQATVQTLLNGYYPTIVDHLRRSISYRLWQDLCGELGTWGTGCNWLGLPVFPVEAELDPNLAARLDNGMNELHEVWNDIRVGQHDPNNPSYLKGLSAQLAALDAHLTQVGAQVGGGGTLTPAQDLALRTIAAQTGAIQAKLIGPTGVFR